MEIRETSTRPQSVVSPAVLCVEPNSPIAGELIRTVRVAGWTVKISSDLRDSAAYLSTRYVRLLVIAGTTPSWTEAALARLRPAAGNAVLVVGPRESIDTLALLRHGADDVVEWRSREEFLARATALCRRQAGMLSTLSRRSAAADLRIDHTSRLCEVGRVRVPLTHNEFDLLQELMARPLQTVSSEQLIQQVWKIRPIDGTNTLRIHVGRLRKKLEQVSPGRTWIESVRGVGYRFAVPVSSEVAEQSTELRELIGIGARTDALHGLISDLTQETSAADSAQAIVEWAVSSGICDVACVFRTDFTASGLLVSERLSLSGAAPLWQRGDHLIGEGFMGAHIYATGESLYLPDVRGQADRFPVTARLFEYAQLRSCVILPIRVDGRVWGDITFINEAENSLTASSADFLGAVAGVSSLAIGSSLAYREYDSDWMNTTSLRPLVA